MFGIPKPYIFGALLFIGFIGGYKVRDWQCDAAYAKVLEKAAKQKAEMQKVVDAKSTAYEQSRSEAEVKSVERTNTIREIYKNVPVPSAVDCPPPPDGVVGLLVESIRDTNTPGSASKSGSAVQKPN